MCLSVDAHSQPQGVSDHFPAGVSRLGLYFECVGAPAGTELAIEWRREGEPVMRQRVAVEGARKAVSYISEREDRPLPAGAYEVHFAQGGVEVYVVKFRVG